MGAPVIGNVVLGAVSQVFSALDARKSMYSPSIWCNATQAASTVGVTYMRLPTRVWHRCCKSGESRTALTCLRDDREHIYTNGSCSTRQEPDQHSGNASSDPRYPKIESLPTARVAI